MRDPEMISRAQQAAASLERAWERWRIMHGLTAEPMPPVSSYVGYSIEEPWGRPRVVFGVDASEAELLARLLDRHECVGPFYEAGRAEGGAGRAAQAAPAVDPLLEEARSRIPAPAQAAEEGPGAGRLRIAQPSPAPLAGRDAAPGDAANDLPRYPGWRSPDEGSGTASRPDDVPYPGERASVPAQAGEQRGARRGERRAELGRSARRERRAGGRQRPGSRHQLGEPAAQDAGTQRRGSQTDTSLTPAAEAAVPAARDPLAAPVAAPGVGWPADAGVLPLFSQHSVAEAVPATATGRDEPERDTAEARRDHAGEADQEQPAQAGWDRAGDPRGGHAEDARDDAEKIGWRHGEDGRQDHAVEAEWDRAEDAGWDEAAHYHAEETGWHHESDAAWDRASGAGLGQAHGVGWDRAGNSGPDQQRDAGRDHAGEAGWDSGRRDHVADVAWNHAVEASRDRVADDCRDQSGDSERGRTGDDGPSRAGDADRDHPGGMGLGAAGGRSDTIAAELAGWAAGELPGQASARLAAWAAIGGVPAPGYHPSGTSSLGSPGTAEPVR